MNRFDIINKYIQEGGYKRYLEIGVLDNEAFNEIDIEHKESVDPNGKATHTMGSDEFFEQYSGEPFDIIFIDGLHEANQVFRDIQNSLANLSEGGTIVCHDMLPTNEAMQKQENMNLGIPWTGDCWKAWAQLRSTRTDLSMFVVDCDWGCGVIKKGEQPLFPIVAITSPPSDENVDQWSWTFFSSSRNKLMNVISVEEFLS